MLPLQVHFYQTDSLYVHHLNPKIIAVHEAVQQNKEHSLHCNVIIGRNPIEANANTGAIQRPGNPSAPTWKPFSHYRKSFSHIGKLPTIGKLTIEAKGFSGRG